MTRCLLLLFCLCGLKSWSQAVDTAKAGTFRGVDLNEIDKSLRPFIGTEYPPLAVTTVDGNSIRSEDLAGKIVLLDFWFEGCAPCRAAFSGLNQLFDSLSNQPDFQFLSLSLDHAYKLPDIIQRHKLRYPVAAISEMEAADLNPGGYPTLVLLDRDGYILFAKRGGYLAPEKAREDLLRNVLPRIRAMLLGPEKSPEDPPNDFLLRIHGDLQEDAR